MRNRIEEVIERSGMTQSQFADFIEVKRPNLSHILAGRNNPSMEVVMKIHQKFPKINILWLLDGIGSYEGDAVADYPLGSLIEDNVAYSDDDALYSQDSESAGSLSTTGETSKSRFYQGELFAENRIFSPESTAAPKNRKEMPLQTPPKAPDFSDSQIEYAKKSMQRKIVEIKIFYDDGTYETFKQ